MTPPNNHFPPAFRWETIPPGYAWPGGHYVDLAQFAVTQVQLGALLDMEPIRGVEDGLGPWKAFCGRVNGVLVELIQYRHEPGRPVFTLRVDATADAAMALCAFVFALNLRAAEVPWINERYAVHPAVLTALVAGEDP